MALRWAYAGMLAGLAVAAFAETLPLLLAALAPLAACGVTTATLNVARLSRVCALRMHTRTHAHAHMRRRQVR